MATKEAGTKPGAVTNAAQIAERASAVVEAAAAASVKGGKKFQVVAVRKGYDGIRVREEGARFTVVALDTDFVTADDIKRAQAAKDAKERRYADAPVGIRKGHSWQQRATDYDAQQSAAAAVEESEE
jgi:hypothetical protein